MARMAVAGGQCMKNVITSIPFCMMMMIIAVIAHTAMCSSGEARAGHLVSPPGGRQVQWSGSSSVVARTVITTIAPTSIVPTTCNSTW